MRLALQLVRRVYARTPLPCVYWFLAIAILLAGSSGCARDPAIVVDLEFVDENGAPAKVTVQLDGRQHASNAAGTLSLALAHPAVVVARGDGLLPEPVALGWSDQQKKLRIRVWRDGGGRRWVMHSAGDAMFGRRYSAPADGPPLLGSDIERDARAIVSHVGPVFAAATVRTLNLETVVSDLPDSAAYPGKRFILNSPPAALAALAELSVDVAGFANNHSRDYMDEGLKQSIEHLVNRGQAWQGASAEESGATSPLFWDVGAARLAFLHYTTVNGDFVNDAYPTDEAVMPIGVAPTEFWQWEPRVWSFQGAQWQVPSAARRIGSAWRLFRDKEDDLTPPERAGAWASLVAVYPELQDWVARRGHGGAAAWQAAAAAREIATARSQSQLVVVQLHAGFQFQPAPSGAVRDNARIAIDAGADIVICHHPHVLQGAEWYKGKLIVYSLGNFIFDQDFFATYASAILRTVWDGTTLLEAKLLPVEIVGYQPYPVVDAAARTGILATAEMSVAGTEAARGKDNAVRVFEIDPLPDTEPALISPIQHMGVIAPPGTVARSETTAFTVAARSIAELPLALYQRTMAVANTIELGRDLLRWGRFENDVANATDLWGAHWVLAEGRKYVVKWGNAAEGNGFLRLLRTATSKDAVLVRPVARIPLTPHRRFRTENGNAVAVDPEAAYSIIANVRRHGTGSATLRLELYRFDDSNPTEDPSSEPIGNKTIAVDIPADNAWHRVEFDVPASLLAAGGVKANMLMLYAGLGTPDAGGPTRDTVFDLDDVAFVEWRNAAAAAPVFAAYRFLRNRGAQAQVVELLQRDPP